MDWVQEKIQRARVEGWTRLDLGNAGLTSIPDEVFTLERLEVLVLGDGYYGHKRDTWVRSENEGPANTITIIPDQIARLTQLSELFLSGMGITTLEPLMGLTNLTWLDLRQTEITTLEPLVSLPHLIGLDLSQTGITTLEPLASLSHLIGLDLGGIGITTLEPLMGLTNLTWLDLSRTGITTLEPLMSLTHLTGLDLSFTRITTLEPLAGLTNLTWLDLSDMQLHVFPSLVLLLPRLRHLSLYGNPIGDMPPEILGTSVYDNCLDAVRAHFADMAQGVALDRTMKLMLLGNGQVGKTSVARRLVHNTFDPQESSTHGIRLQPWDLDSDDGPVYLNVWDFGGQDIYHGTHALFLRSKALFLLVWDRETEQLPGYAEGELFFEYYPLQYWLDYIHNASPGAPVLVVENKCDNGLGSIPPVPTTAPHVICSPPFSAKAGHGGEVLRALIRDLCQRELANRGTREIGIGRWRVKQTLQRYLAEDESHPPAERRYRTLSYDQFQQLCDAQQGQETSARALLDYLHHSGVVFYQEGIFHNQIILDQRWAIDAIYTLFHREHCYRQLLRKQGRFTRSDLHDLLWRELFTEDEQKLLLSFMESCALCFRTTDGDDPEYVAPDLLPARDTLAQELAYRRPASGTATPYHYTYTHAFLHQGVMRRFLVAMGREFRDTALFWKDGVFIHPPDIQAIAEITCQRRVDGHPAGGRITIEVWGHERNRLLNWLRRQLDALHDREPASTQVVSLDGQHWVNVAKLPDARLTGHVVSQAGVVLEAQPFLFLIPVHVRMELQADDAQSTHEPATHKPAMHAPPVPMSQPAIYISYAWDDPQEIGPSREAIVDRLYDALLADGYRVKRDKMDLGYKGLISTFMGEIGRGDCIVVVISDKYLKSPFCMFELLEIYRHEAFYDRICPIMLSDARLHTLADRLTYVAYWKAELARIEQLLQQVGIAVLSASGSFQEYEKYRDITQQADKLLTYLADINSQTPPRLAANDFETLKRAIDARLRQLSASSAPSVLSPP